eukprot:5739347-Prymnesium_polylepis.3
MELLSLVSPARIATQHVGGGGNASCREKVGRCDECHDRGRLGVGARRRGAGRQLDALSYSLPRSSAHSELKCVLRVRDRLHTRGRDRRR